MTKFNINGVEVVISKDEKDNYLIKPVKDVKRQGEQWFAVGKEQEETVSRWLIEKVKNIPFRSKDVGGKVDVIYNCSGKRFATWFNVSVDIPEIAELMANPQI
jgi:hypothetical protein